MKITTCYTVPMKEQLFPVPGTNEMRPGRVDDALMRATADICLAAYQYCADVWLKEWEYLEHVPVTAKEGVISRKRVCDVLIHTTESSEAKYSDFDKLFACMPSYVRRAIIADSLGAVSSYKSNHKNWEALSPAERGSEPVLAMPDRYELTFYKQERDVSNIGEGAIRLKLYNGKTWDWYTFRISGSDARYIAHMKKTRTMLSPVVEKVFGKYKICFSFQELRSLVQNDNPFAYRILAVDLGVNAPASWCVMESDGTVHAKGVIRLRCDEDRLCHLINRKRMYQQAGKKPRDIYRMVNAANRQLSIDTSRELIRIAVLYDVDCIVFEYLDRSGKVKGKRYAERIHLWRANNVQDRVELQAHRNGMRISRVCAWGTSKFAFDGSGPVTRDKHNHSICTFMSGKQYNSDLSAAMNIGARYFLRLYAALPECPELPATPQRTYSTLLGLMKSLAA